MSQNTEVSSTAYADTLLELKAMLTRNVHFDDYKDIADFFDRLRPILNKELGLTFECHSRLKSVNSIVNRLQLDSDYKFNDIIGVRLTNPWTKNIHLIADYLKTKLKIESELVTERNRVIYLFGKTERGNIYEIQLWTNLIYHCFEFEHDRVYKPVKELSDEEKNKALIVRDEQHKVQDIIDAHTLVPY